MRHRSVLCAERRKNPSIQELASRLYTLLYTAAPQLVATDDCEVCSPRQMPRFVRCFASYSERSM